MAKLYFRFGAMNSSKSQLLMTSAFNYEERGQRVVVIKPGTDVKGGSMLVSRAGMSRKVDLLVGPDQSPWEAIEDDGGPKVACLFVDEAQFLSPAQAEDLFLITVLANVPVIAYGLRTDFRGQPFPGAARLLELAHTLEEIKTICRCGSKALFNARFLHGTITLDGPQVAVEGVTDGETYESLCGACYVAALNTAGLGLPLGTGARRLAGAGI